VPHSCHSTSEDSTLQTAKMTEKAVAQVKHFNDFPNDAGFRDIPETRTPIELKVKGKIPEYVRGVLYRNGPGSYTTKCKNGQIFKVQHWFSLPFDNR